MIIALVIALGVVVALLIAATIFFIRSRERDARESRADLHKVLSRQEEEIESLLDRLHATKNLPPSAIDLATEFKKRQERTALRETERVNGGALQSGPRRVGVGPVDNAVVKMELESAVLKTEIEARRAAAK